LEVLATVQGEESDTPLSLYLPSVESIFLYLLTPMPAAKLVSDMTRCDMIYEMTGYITIAT
jgi:hypothetical protein